MTGPYGWYTDPATRCPAVHTSPYRGPIQCTRDAHPTGAHESRYTGTAWAGLPTVGTVTS